MRLRTPVRVQDRSAKTVGLEPPLSGEDAKQT